MFRGLLQDPDGRQRINRVTVFERPGLHEFLQRTSEFADLVLFTAGLEGLISSTIFLFRKQKQVDFTSRHWSVLWSRLCKTSSRQDRCSQQIHSSSLSAINCYYVSCHWHFHKLLVMGCYILRPCFAHWYSL